MQNIDVWASNSSRVGTAHMQSDDELGRPQTEGFSTHLSNIRSIIYPDIFQMALTVLRTRAYLNASVLMSV